MEKIDYKKTFKTVYNQRKNAISIIEVPPLQYISVKGQGDPNTSKSFQDAIQALYSLSYNLKFFCKKHNIGDYVVMPLEGQWYAGNLDAFTLQNKNEWEWTLQIMQPNIITKELFENARRSLLIKGELPSLEFAMFEEMHEGECAQIMHFGSFTEEEKTVMTLHAFIEENRYVINGNHREIYLSDFRKCAPEKLKTIIRYPIIKK